MKNLTNAPKAKTATEINAAIAGQKNNEYTEKRVKEKKLDFVKTSDIEMQNATQRMLTMQFITQLKQEH